MKLGTAIPYLNTTFFFTGDQKALLYQEIQI